MKKMKMWLLMAFFNGIFMSYVYGQPPSNDNAYALVFEDDFNGTSVDYTKWDRIPSWNQSTNIIQTPWCSQKTMDIGYRKWKTGVQGQMDTTNCKVSNGSVKLYARKENYIGEVWSWPNEQFTVQNLPFKYTTAMLYSKFHFRYGYFEIRFKLPPPPPAPKKHLGFGPNFWLYSADKNAKYGWKNYWSEIDVFEIDASHNGLNNLYTNNVHYENRECPNFDLICHPRNTQSVGYISSDEWHTASVNWTPSAIEFYLDGIKLRDFPCEQFNLPPDSLVAMPMFIDINVPTSNFCTAFDTVNANGTEFPYIFEIDYVKVWQLKAECDSSKLYCTFPSNYDSKLYKSITIGNSSCNAPIQNQSNISVYATDYILLQEGMSIDTQSNVVFDTQECIDSQVRNRLSRVLENNNEIEIPIPSFYQKHQY